MSKAQHRLLSGNGSFLCPTEQMVRNILP